MVFLVESDAGFDFLAHEYWELFSCSKATAFQHPFWLHRVYTKLAVAAKAEPLIITVRSKDDGRLLLVLPLVRQRLGALRVVEFADLHVCDYAAPICSDSILTQLSGDETVRARIQQALAPYDLIRVQKIPGHVTPLQQLLGAKPGALMKMSAYAVPLASSFSQWRSDHMDPSYRKELDKKRRQLNRKGRLRFECLADPSAIKDLFCQIQRFRQPRFPDDLLQKPPYFEFYLDVAVAGAKAGFSRAYAFFSDDKPIAGVLALTHNRECLVILGGFDLEGFKNYSIGSLLFESIASDCIEKGDVNLDFTIGDEAYKRLFGAQPAGLWTLTRAGSSVGSVATFVVDKLPG